MKIAAKSAIAALCFSAALAGPALAQDRVEIGRLQCNVEGSVGMIIGSTKKARCAFYEPNKNKPVEYYSARINKLGLDIGFTEKSVIQWIVLAPKANKYDRGVLAGKYVGVSGEATVGVGLGGNALIGGSSKSFALQPLSVQGQTGLNLAIGIAEFQLTAL